VANAFSEIRVSAQEQKAEPGTLAHARLIVDKVDKQSGGQFDT
jgi:hypothetical protein